MSRAASRSSRLADALTGRYVPQRNDRDCLAASIATATGLSYDRTARIVPEGAPIEQVPAMLVRLGYSGTVLVPAEASPGPMANTMPTRADIARMMRGSSGLFFLPDRPGEDHSVAWRNGRLIDCRNGATTNSLERLPFNGAILIEPLRNI